MRFNPLHKDRRQLLDAARTGDGRPLPRHLKAEILREIELIELLLRQIADVEAEREVLAADPPAPVSVVRPSHRRVALRAATPAVFSAVSRRRSRRSSLAADAVAQRSMRDRPRGFQFHLRQAGGEPRSRRARLPE